MIERQSLSSCFSIKASCEWRSSSQDAISKAWFMSAPKGPTNLPIVLATAKEMASGLAFLHSQGLVHGDLSSGE